jgi:hypothetical protein
MANKIPDIKEPIYILQSYIEKLIDSNCEEIPYEGINIDKSTLKSDILELVLNQRKDYATFHVEAALKAAAGNAEVVMIESCSNHTPYWGVCGTCGSYSSELEPTEEVDKDSILKSYSLENIK